MYSFQCPNARAALPYARSVRQRQSRPTLRALPVPRIFLISNTNTHAARTRTDAHEIDGRPGAQSSVTSNAATQ
jgi:hypothetical protein